MGFLRFLLALSVIVTHSQPIFGITLLPGNLAVESFFIISGFYMTMVLKEKYFKIDKYYKLFISNRFLRIYPLYWFVILIIIVFYIAEGLRMGNYHYLQLYADYWHKVNPLAFLYIIITNIIIIGQEYAVFFTVNDNGTLSYATHSLTTKTPLIKFMLDVPLWTVSLELLFYLVSPVLVKLKNRSLLIVIIALLVLRLVSKITGIAYDPYIYRLLPYQIVFFLLGILSYNIYNYMKEVRIPEYIYIFLFVYIASFTIFYGNITDSELKDFIYLASSFIFIPFAFKYLKNSKTDRYIGELSYPMYISHFIFLDLSERITNYLHLSKVYFPILGICTTVLFSALLVQIFNKRIEAYRAKRVKLKSSN
jgi:peptidoglycan/LPS O-acetylase OafA/YrhL